MIITGSIITAIVVLLVISLILFYNGMVRGRNMVEEAWSGISVQLKRRHDLVPVGISVQLKRRHDLVPVLVNSVKGYMTHEQETLTRIAELRASAVSASSSGSVQAIAHAENQLMGALRSLFAVSENYPELRASENFMHLQEQLALLDSSRGQSDVQKWQQYLAKFFTGLGRLSPDEYEKVKDSTYVTDRFMKMVKQPIPPYK